MRSILLCALGIFLVLIDAANALNCYQGQQNMTLPVSGSASACPSVSLSCLKTYDNYTQLVTRACQTTNCTMNGVVNPTGFCQNTTQYPYQTYCCCYGDGCNSAPMRSSILLNYGWVAIALMLVGCQLAK